MDFENQEDDFQRKSNGRTLEISCEVCDDFSTGKHYGIYACDGCSGFFKRSIRRKRKYICRAIGTRKGKCIVDKVHRNQCRACRLERCFAVNMNKDAVQHERGPRNFVIQKQKRLQKNLTINSTPELDSYFESFIAKLRSAELDLKIVPFKSFQKTDGSIIYNAEEFGEMVARLLFKCVGWVKNISGLLNICFNDQVLLLEESWTELYVLDVSQNLEILNNPLFLADQTHNQNCTNDAWSFVRLFKATLEQLHSINLDTVEYLCVKAICLLKPIIRGLKDVVKIEMLQDQIQEMLGDYECKIRRKSSARFGKILLISAGLSRVDKKVVEEVFFKNNMGNVPVGNILGNMHLCYGNSEIRARCSGNLNY